MSNPIAGFHIVRYGTAADQKFMANEFADTYDQIVINANMVAHMPSALRRFLEGTSKPYFIDPQTHAFQHDIGHLQSDSTEDIKRSIKGLIQAYGEPVLSIVGKRKESVLPDDFKNTARRVEFCQKVLQFQKDTLPKESEASDVAKYYEFAAEEEGTSPYSFAPSMVVAPYFYMTAKTFSEWLNINLMCAQDSRDACSGPLGVQIVISRELLVDRRMRNALCTRYRRLKPDCFLVWVDGLTEQEASEVELGALVDLLKRLTAEAQVVNLYGGYFSVALKHCGTVPGLSGVTHSMEYGESRGVVPVGGGIPVAKYYYPALHVRLPFRDAVRAARESGGFRSVASFRERVCGCAECVQVTARNPEVDFGVYGKTRPVSFFRRNQPIVTEYPIQETKEHCVRHYMWCKSQEFRFADCDAIRSSLAQAHEAFKRVLGLETVAHCNVWQRLLSS